MNLKPAALTLLDQVKTAVDSPAASLVPVHFRRLLVAQAGFIVVLSERIDALEREVDAHRYRTS
jgi:hypothetical protein